MYEKKIVEKYLSFLFYFVLISDAERKNAALS